MQKTLRGAKRERAEEQRIVLSYSITIAHTSLQFNFATRDGIQR
jgi:hypothetical protein